MLGWIGRLRGSRSASKFRLPRPRRSTMENLEERVMLSATDEGQHFAYLVNRVRHEPSMLASMGVDLPDVDSRPPLAVNSQLTAAAQQHASEMADHDYFSHQSSVTDAWPNEVVRDHGYQLPAAWPDNANFVESIVAGQTYAVAKSALSGLLENSAGSGRLNLEMLLGGDIFSDRREIGVGFAADESAMLENYWTIETARRGSSAVYLTGVVFDDANDNGLYDSGEGIGGATVTVGQKNVRTGAAGGWSLGVSPGSHVVTTQGGSFTGTSTATVDVTNDNREIDFISGRSSGVVDFAHWNNSANPFDVNTDGIVSALDVLQTIRAMDEQLEGLLPDGGRGVKTGTLLPDVNADGYLNPTDTLAIINHLNSWGRGEGEDSAIAGLDSEVAWSQTSSSGILNADGVPGDQEMLVNSLIPRLQTSDAESSAVATNAAGLTIVAFSGRGPIDREGVFVRRFDNHGDPIGEAFRVNSTIREAQGTPSVAIDDAGDFLVVWQGRGPGDQSGVFAQWYGANGQPQGSETLINTTTGGKQINPAVAMSSSGYAVVVWEGVGIGDLDGIQMRRFAPNRSQLGAEQLVNSETGDRQAYPSVAMNSAGEFVITWSSRHQDGSDWGVFSQRYSATGETLGSEYQVNDNSANSQFHSSVGLDDAGNSVIVWSGLSSDGTSWDIFARRFDGSGLPFGPEQPINTMLAGHQRDAHVAMAPGGNFAITWTSGIPDGSGWEVHARLYDAAGQASSVVQVNSITGGSNSGHQRFSAVAVGGGPTAYLVWSGRGVLDHGGVFINPIDIVPSNQSPMLDAVPSQIIDEQVPFSISLHATDTEKDRLVFELLQGPAGSRINAETGQFQWTPTEIQGRRDELAIYSVTAEVAEKDNPQHHDQITFTITVQEVNEPPVLQPIADQLTDIDSEVVFTAVATDPDLPVNGLTYSLETGAPDGLTVEPGSGEITWVPTTAESFDVTLRVTDDGVPPLSDTTTFQVAGGGCQVAMPDGSFSQSGGSPDGHGTADLNECNIVMTEGDSFVVTWAIPFTIPVEPSAVSFTYEGPSFDFTDLNFINDAFEVALVDVGGNSLVQNFTPGRDAFFNVSEDLAPLFREGIEVDGQTITVGLNGIPVDTEATIIFRLVNNDTDTTTTVEISDVALVGSNLLVAAPEGLYRGTVLRETLASLNVKSATALDYGPTTIVDGSVFVPNNVTTDSMTVAEGFVLDAASAATEGDVDLPQSPALDSLLNEASMVVFSTANDFSTGKLFNVSIDDAANAIQLNARGGTEILPIIWISNSGEGTVSKFNTRTGQELGRYRTGANSSTNPSRIAVMADGAAWVANRGDDSNVPYNAVKILHDGFIDRNGNGVIDTSRDLDGDGHIAGAELLPWDANSDGLPDDERIALFVHAGRNADDPTQWTYGGGARGIAIDANGKLWVGLQLRRQYEVFDEATGAFEKVVSVSGKPYGSVVDSDGVLYSSTATSNQLDRIDTDAQSYLGAVNIGSTMYGITLDQNGIVWTSGYTGSHLTRYDPSTGDLDHYDSATSESSGGGIVVDNNGDVWAAHYNGSYMFKWEFEEDDRTLIAATTVPTGANALKGAAVDADGFVWTTSLSNDVAIKIDPNTNQVVLTVETGDHPYNYSDSTGSVRANLLREGTWAEIIDAARDGAAWASLTLDADAQAPSVVRARVRASDSRSDLDSLPWIDRQDTSSLLGVMGRFLEVEVILESTDPSVSPMVESIVVTAIPQPQIKIFTPDAGTDLPPGDVLLTGIAIAGQPAVEDALLVPNRIIAVQINGVTSEALDPSGNFFSHVEAKPGRNLFIITAIDLYGQTTVSAVEYFGVVPGDIDFSRFSDITGSFSGVYGRTSFDEAVNTLHVELATRNDGTFEANVPLLVGVKNISDPSVSVAGADGVTPEGIPYFDYTSLVPGGTLEPGELTGSPIVSFFNPEQTQFDYELVFLGRLNEPPIITTVPDVEAIVDRPYDYDLDAIDADGDLLTYEVTTAPTGSTFDTATGELTWTPTTDDIGIHDVVIQVDDGRGGIAEQHYSLTVTTAPPNRPPIIVSTPVTEAMIGEQKPLVNETIDLGAWSVVQYELNGQPDANWTLKSENSVARQSVNADASILLSDFILDNDRIDGSWQVATKGDDDFMGFVFGYQDSEHYYLFDWKQGDQTSGKFAQRGMSVKVVSADSPLTSNDFWPSAGNGERVRPLFHNTIPWRDQTEYQFTLDFHPGQFTITVHQGEEVLDTILISDDTYTTGGFGFYNYSQGEVLYSGFTRTSLAEQTYQYSVDAIDPDDDTVEYSLIAGPEGMKILPTTGQITWGPTNDQIGNHQVTVAASDGRGGVDTQLFTVCVHGDPNNHDPVFVSEPVTTVVASPSFSYSDFSNINGLTLNGATTQSGDFLRVVPAAYGQTGSVYHTAPVPLADGFESTFEFRVAPSGPDGLAFVIQGESATVDGGTGGFLGYGALENAVALEFDTYNNGSGFGIHDPNDNHMAVITAGAVASEASHTNALATVSPGFDIDDGAIHHVTVRYTPGSLQVFLDGASSPTIDVALDLEDIRGDSILDDQGYAWLGISAGTGVRFTDHDLHSWTFSTLKPAYEYDANALDPDNDDLTYSLVDGPEGMTVDSMSGGINWLAAFSGSNLNVRADYFAEDLNTTDDADGGADDPIRPQGLFKVQLSQADFLRKLQDVRVEDFESFSSGNLPTTIRFGADEATLSGTGSVREVATGTLNGAFPTSGDKFLFQDAAQFQLDFGSPQAAFGFTATDTGEGSQLYLDVHHVDETVEKIDIPLTIGPYQGSSLSGSAIFVGLIDTAVPFTRIVFHLTQGGSDNFGFDDFIIGRAENVIREPIPVTLQVADGRGGVGEQSFTIEILPSGSSEIHGTKFDSGGTPHNVIASSTFDTDLDDWTDTPANSAEFRATDGNPDGFLRVLDINGDSGFISAPEEYLGDWTSLEGGALRYDHKIIAIGQGINEFLPNEVQLDGPGGSAIWIGDQIESATDWLTIDVPLIEAEWTLTSGDWTNMLADVTSLQIRSELVDNNSVDGDVNGIDNVRLIGFGLADWTIYLDQNNNSRLDPGERFTVTDENGDYAFTGLNTGTYIVREEQQAGWTQTYPSTTGSLQPTGDGFPDVVLEYFASGAAGRVEPFGREPNTGHNGPVDPDVVLGPPSPSPRVGWNRSTGWLSLPTGSHVTVGFNDETIIDGPGDDIFIRSLDPADSAGESADVFVSSDSVNFMRLGIAPQGGNVGLDLADIGFTDAVQAVRIVGLDQRGASPGFDLVSIEVLPGALGPGDGSHTVILHERQIADGIDFGNSQTTTSVNGSPAFTSEPTTTTLAAEVYRYDAQATDPAHAPLSFDLVSAPAGMTVQPERGTVVWIPTREQVGTHHVVLMVQNDRGGVDLQSFEIRVETANNAPVITSEPVEIAGVDRAWRYRFNGQDADDAPITFELSGPADMQIEHTDVLTESGIVIGQMHDLVWTPSDQDLGDHTITLTAADGRRGEFVQEFILHVSDSHGNTAPQITSTPPTTGRIDRAYDYTVRATDTDGDAIGLSLGNAPANMTIDAAGIVRWLPAADDIGDHDVEIITADGQGGITAQLFVISVGTQDANTAPVIVSTPNLHASLERTYQYDVIAFDADGDPLSYSLVSAPRGMSINADSGTIRWNPDSLQFGPHTVVLEVQDAQLATSRQRYDVHVRCGNTAPLIVSVPITRAIADRVYFYPVRAEDLEGDPVTFDLPVAPEGMEIGSETGLIRWTPTNAQFGPHDIEIRVVDISGAAETQSYTVVVLAADSPIDPSDPDSPTLGNRPPIVTSTPEFFGEVDSLYLYDVRATDPDGDVISFALDADSLDRGMAIDAESGTITWTPGAEHEGEHLVSITVTDSGGAIAAQGYLLAVSVNSPPTLTPIPDGERAAGSKFLYTVSASDVDDDPLSYSLADAPEGMTIDPFGRIIWQTTPDTPLATHSITVSVTDDHANTDSDVFDLTLIADTMLPRISVVVQSGSRILIDGDTTDAGSQLTFRVAATDNVGIESIGLTINDTPLALDSAGRGTLTTNDLGQLLVEAIAIDLSGNEGTTQRTIEIVLPDTGTNPVPGTPGLPTHDGTFDPSDNQPPNVVITSPELGVTITDRVSIIGTVDDPEDNLWYYRVYQGRLDQVNLSNLNPDDPDYVLIGEGTEEVIDGELAVFETALLSNDVYAIIVVAYDTNGQGYVQPTTVAVEGNILIGNFHLEFTDLSLPLAGITINVTRVYDTTNANDEGDFGFGWTLGVQDARILETVPAGTSFVHDTTKVYLTNPEGRRVGFTFTPSCQGSWFGTVCTPHYTPDPGVYDQLSGGGQFGASGILGALGGNFNPDTYTLTTKAGLKYRYNQSSGLQHITDLSGNKVTFTEDGISHSSGTAIEFIRDHRGRIRQIIDPDGNTIDYTYDAAGDLRSVTNQAGITSSYVYHDRPAHFLDEAFDSRGDRVFKVVFDEHGRFTAVLDALENTIDSRNYDELADNLAVIRDANGNETTLLYDDRGNVLEETDPLGGVTYREYNDPANPDLETRIIDRRGMVTDRAYDNRGNVRQVIELGPQAEPFAQPRVTEFTYDGKDNVRSITNALDHSTTFGYDGSGNLNLVTNAEGNSASFTYDGEGRRQTFTDFNGNTTIFEYNNSCPCGSPSKVVFADDTYQTFAYNQYGQVTEEAWYESDGTLVQIQSTKYDNVGRVIEETSGGGDDATTVRKFYDGELLDYEIIVNPVSPDETPDTPVEQRKSRITDFEYDANGRVVRQIDAEGGVVEFRYDAAGNRILLQDPVGNITTWTYDDLGRVREERDPFYWEGMTIENVELVIDDESGASCEDNLGASHVRLSCYDEEGNLAQKIDRNGRRTDFDYDFAGRMLTEAWYNADGSFERTISFTYDTLGNMLTGTDPDSTLTFTYDALNRLKSVDNAGTPDAPNVVLTYGYDAQGNVTLTQDDSGVAVTSTYDQRNRLATRDWSGGDVDSARVDFLYNAADRATLINRWADLDATDFVGATVRTYDTTGRSDLLTHRNSVDELLAGYDYDYDFGGLVTHEQRTHQDSQYAQSIEYKYDRTSQLVDALFSGQDDEHFEYDANGNRITSTAGDETRTYTTGPANQLESDNLFTYKYDGEGNLVLKTDRETLEYTEYTYDHRSRLIGVVQKSSGGLILSESEYTYDVLGRRIQTVVNGQELNIVYNGDNTWADFDENGAIVTRYLFGNRIDDNLARYRPAQGTAWYVTDRLWTVRDLVIAGATASHISYRVFGKVLPNAGDFFTDRFTFTGREINFPSGTLFFRARIMDPISGRFNRKDPLGFQSSDVNLYRYVNNNPVNNVDPQGETALVIWGIATTIVLYSVVEFGQEEACRYKGVLCDPDLAPIPEMFAPLEHGLLGFFRQLSQYIDERINQKLNEAFGDAFNGR